MFSFLKEKLNINSSVVTIGNFDGCHIAHKTLIEKNQSYAKKLGTQDIVVSFNPRPQEYFRPSSSSRELFTQSQKQRAMNELNVGKLLVLNFNDELFHLSHEAFYEKILKDLLKVKAISIGENFRFGKNREGSADWLKMKGDKDNIEVYILPSVHQKNQIVSSTVIRELLLNEGNSISAAKLLGRPYGIEGVIESGDQKGRQLGFPTLNLSQTKQLLPKHGVYCGLVWLEGESTEINAPTTKITPSKLISAAFHLGYRPSIDEMLLPRFEAHLLSGSWPKDGSFYGKKACFYLTERIRDVRKFSQIHDLKQQISEDVNKAKSILNVD